MGIRPQRWSAIFALAMLGFLFAVPSEARRPRRRQPVPQLYRPAGSDHRKHIVQRIPLPVGTEIKAGRYFGRAALPRGPRAAAQQADFYLRSAQLLVSVRARDGALLSLATAPGFVATLRGGAPAVCDLRGRHPAFLTSIRIVSGTPPELETRARVAGGPELELTTRYRLLGAPGQAPDALEIDSTLTHRDTRARRDVRLCEVWTSGDDPTPTGLRPSILGRRGAQRWIVRARGELWVERRGGGQQRVHYPRRDLAPGGSLQTRRLLLLADKTSRAALAARAARWAGERWKAVALKLPAKVPPSTRLVLLRAGRRYLTTALGPRIVLPSQRGMRWSVALQVAGVGLGKPALLAPQKRKEPIALALPPLARLALRIRDTQRKPLAAQIDVLPRDENAHPRRANSLGDSSLWLAPGVYLLQVRRPDGRHRSVRRELKLMAGQTRQLTVTLPAAFDASDWVALDTRLVASKATAWRAAAAAGIDAAISTELGALGSSPPREVSVASISGQLLAPRRQRHGRFVAFPLKASIDDEAATPTELFARARQAGARFIAVVAPWARQKGYFAQLGLDSHQGRAASKRYDEHFELLEVLSSSATAAQEERALRTFLALVGRGKRVLASAGSGPRSGANTRDWPRLLVPRPLTRGKPPGRANAAMLLSALQSTAGRSVATRGPHVTITVDKKRLTVRLDVVDDDMRTQPTLLELYRGGTLVRRLPIPRPRAGVTRMRHTFTITPTELVKLVIVVRGRPVHGGRVGRLLAIVNPPAVNVKR